MNQFNASLWRDEAFSALIVQNPLKEIIVKVAKDTSPPLYYLLLHLWTRIFGNSEPALRNLSVIFFILTVVFVYLIGKKLFGKREGLIAGILTLVNPFLLSYAFEARMYSLLTFACTASMYFFIKGSWAWYILFTLIALYTHHFAILLVGAQVIIFLIKPKEWKKTLLSFLILGVLYLPWIPIFFRQTALVKSNFWLGKPDLKSLIGLFRSYLIGDFKINIFLELTFFFSIALLFLRNWKSKFQQTLSLVLWLIIPVLVSFLVSFIIKPIFFSRYLLFTVPALTLIIASSQRKIRKLPISLLLVSIIFITLLINGFNFFFHPTNREPFAQLAAYAKTYQNENLAMINLGTTHIFESRYYGLNAPIYSPKGDIPYYIGTVILEKNDVINKLPEKEFLLAISDDNNTNDLPGYKFLKKDEFGNIKLLWFKKYQK